ncbi:hypothetical protein C8Q76DRAFT_795072 [Earliella scabrosa]|nr:hypothetical protein C8Q76DRAFT_795072 [Earliella scabrosa]
MSANLASTTLATALVIPSPSTDLIPHPCPTQETSGDSSVQPAGVLAPGPAQSIAGHQLHPFRAQQRTIFSSSCSSSQIKQFLDAPPGTPIRSSFTDADASRSDSYNQDGAIRDVRQMTKGSAVQEMRCAALNSPVGKEPAPLATFTAAQLPSYEDLPALIDLTEAEQAALDDSARYGDGRRYVIVCYPPGTL